MLFQKGDHFSIPKLDLKAKTREPTIGDELGRASGLTRTAIGIIVTRAREPTPTARTRDQPRNQDLTHACKQACEHTLTQHSRYAHNPMYNHMGHTRNHARQQSKNRANTQTHTNTPTHTNTQTSKQTNKHTNKDTTKQTNTQTDTHASHRALFAASG